MTLYESLANELQALTETLVNSYNPDVNNISHKVHDIAITSYTLYSLDLLTSKEYVRIKRTIKDKKFGLVSLIHEKRTNL